MKTEHIIVHGKNALVKVHKVEEKKQGSLYIPVTTVKDAEITHGTIIKLGSDPKDCKMDIKAGDEVIWNPFSQTTLFKLDNSDLAIVKYEDIIVTLID